MEGPQELDKHIPKIQQHLDALLNACKAKEGWKETGTKKNIYIDHKAVEGGRFAMRGSGDMPGAKVDDIWNLILDFPNWKDWDKMIIEKRTLEDGTICFIMYSAYSSPAPLIVSHRDFVTFVIVKRTPEGDMLYSADSVEHPKCPPGYSSKVGLGSNFVRGTVTASGSWTRKTPGKDNSITMTYVVQLDPKGSVPTWIVNIVASDQPLNIAVMRDHVEHQKKKKDKK